MNEASKRLIQNAQDGFCVICKKDIVLENDVRISYQEFNGVNIAVCAEHPQP